MRKKPVFILFTLTLFSLVAGLSRLTLHPKNGNDPIVISDGNMCDSGVLFHKVYEVSCVCLTGLWVFYRSDCESAHSLHAGVDDQCISLDISIRKVKLLSAYDEFESNFTSSVAIFDQKMVAMPRKFDSMDGYIGADYYVPPGFPVVVTTGGQSWRLPSENLCLKPSTMKDNRNTLFCIFKLKVSEEYFLRMDDCLEHDKEVKPLRCSNYLEDRDFGDHSDPRSCKNPKGRRIRSLSEDEAGQQDGGGQQDGRGQQAGGGQQGGGGQQAGGGQQDGGGQQAGGGQQDGGGQQAAGSTQAAGKPQGRVFLGAVAGLKDNTTSPPGAPPSSGNGTGGATGSGNDTSSNDEDENSGLGAIIDQPILNSELWNYMTLRAKETLGIFKSKAGLFSRNNFSPGFTFLQYAKKIQQKVCPDHYVRDDHYDVAIGAFASIQQNHFRYADPFVDYETATRIEGALMACLANMTEYPFLERIYKDSSVVCNGTPPITHGSYKMFDQTLDLDVRYDIAARNNEPIVETVWKVFVHAHSACFPFFEKYYNDHHRFTTIMLPLFTNEINDIWFNVTELRPEIYSGFLGDAVDLMDSVTFCSAFSRLESEYPWDLPRPKKDNARRKRDVAGDPSYECLYDEDARSMHKCLLDDPAGSFGGRNVEYSGNELDAFS